MGVMTVPDVRNPKRKKFFPISFIMSIVWIAVYSFLMVWWATIIGLVAVSSSIGSNIFDILIGLPVPWMAYSFANNMKPMSVYSDSLFVSVITLVGMLMAVIATIAACKWQMSKAL